MRRGVARLRANRGARRNLARPARFLRPLAAMEDRHSTPGTSEPLAVRFLDRALLLYLRLLERMGDGAWPESRAHEEGPDSRRVA